MPCNVDIATQEILKLAEAADPTGARTMGVLTKPDLATEIATRAAVLDLVLGKRSRLKLGYYVVKNRSADDDTSNLAQRYNAEKAFFSGPEWRPGVERCGVTVLKDRLRHLLQKISKEELPHVKAEIDERLRRTMAERESMGPARADAAAQRLYLGGLAARFQKVTQAALGGHYASDPIFGEVPETKLITRVLNLHSAFSEAFAEQAHMHYFDNDSEDEEEPAAKAKDDNEHSNESREDSDESTELSEIPVDKYFELHDIIAAEYACPAPRKEPIMDTIKKTYAECRGPELGTVKRPSPRLQGV